MNDITARGLFVVAVALLLALPLAAGASEADSRRLFDRLDSNRDGQLAREELRPEHSALFTRLIRKADADQNGQLSPAEFAQGLHSQRPAKPLIEKPSGKLPGADALMLLLAKMDTNGDRHLEAEEVPDRYLPFFKRMEQRSGGKKDGRIERRELTQAAPRLCQMAEKFAEQQGIDVAAELARLPEQQINAMERMSGTQRPFEMLNSPEQAKRMFAAWDADGDGQVTENEIPEPLSQFFERLLAKNDKNADGQLSQKELVAASRRIAAVVKKRSSPEQIEKEVDRWLRRFDRDGDEQLSPEEAPPRVAGRFNKFDKNSDGSLGRQELERGVKLLSPIRGSVKPSNRSPRPPKPKRPN